MSTNEDWRTAIAEIVYTPHLANLPAYLDIEDDVLIACAERVEPGVEHTMESAQAALVQAALTSIDLSPGAMPSEVLYVQALRSANWRRARRADNYDPWNTPPPSLPFLAAMSRAAELMAADETFAAHNYYDRLVGLLGVPADRKDLLRGGIARVSERLWDDLNTWLDDMGGSRGLPTAEAIGHRYVGLPISQAMIRAADRTKFSEFFEDAGFSPGQSLALSDLEEYVDQWLVHGALGPQSGLASLRAIWRKGAGKGVLTQALSTALALWDGSLAEGVPGAARPRGVLLTARIARQGAFAPVRLHLSVALRGRLEGPRALPELWQVTSSRESPKPEISFRVEDERYLVPSRRLDGVDNEGLLEGRVTLSPALATEQRGAPSSLERTPRPVVVLVDMGSGTFIEAEHAQMGEEHLVLVNERPQAGRGRSRYGPGGPLDVGRALAEISQPGIARLTNDDLPGVPPGWAVYKGVRVISRLDTDSPVLEPLVTIQTGSLGVTGGLRLPGLTRRWSTEAPITITATVPEDDTLEVTLERVEATDDVTVDPLVLHGEHGQMLDTISTLARPSGSYRLELRSPIGNGRVRQSHAFQQVSADHPRAMPRNDDGPGPALAREVSPGSVDVPIPLQTPRPATYTNQTIAHSPWWLAPDEAFRTVRAAEPDASGCAVTGAHRWHLETHQGGTWDRARCTGCGMERLYRARGVLRKELKENSRAGQDLTRPVELPQFAHAEISGVAVLDALGWLGGGSAYELAHVLRQGAADSLGADELLRMLESTGHVDVTRNADMSIEHWTLAPKTAAQTREGQWGLIGTWGQGSLRAFRRALLDAGIQPFTTDRRSYVPVRLIDAEAAALEPIARALSIAMLPDAGATLLEGLRPLSSVGRSLPRAAAEGIFDAERLDLATGRWVDCRSIAAPGAYRVRRGFTRHYLFRDSHDVASGEAVRGTPQLTKHLAANAAGKPLLAHSPGTKRLYVPLGAELPGLYGRAMTQLSARPAFRDRESPSLVYESVGRREAEMLFELMTN